MDDAEHQVARIRKRLEHYKEWAKNIDAEPAPADDLAWISYRQTSFMLKLVVRELEAELDK